MITIITGKTKAGKTTKMLEMYNQLHEGDGFICQRVLKNNKFYGYELTRLSSGKSTPLKCMECYYQLEGYYDKSCLGYRYSSQAYNDALLDIKAMIKAKVEPIYLDGITDMELLKKGFDECLLTLLKSHLDIVISVPDKLVRKVILHYRLKDYKIISVK